MLVTFVVPVVLVRVLSKADYGQYAQIILLYGLFFRVLQFGLRQSLFYYLPTQRENRGYYVTNTFLSFLTAGLVFFLILTVFRQNLAQLFSADELTLLLPLCGLHTLFMLVSSPFETILIIDSKAEKASVIVFASEVVRCILIVTFVLVFKTLFSAILGLVCFSSIRLVAYSLYAFKYYGVKFDRNNLKHFQQQLNYAVPIGFSGILGNTARRTDKFILAAFFTPEIYAVYTVGNFKVPLVRTFFASVGQVILPKAVKLLKKGKVDQFIELWRKLLVRFFFVGIAAFFALQLVAHDFVTLIFTSKYESSIPVFRIILFLILVQMFQRGKILRALGHTTAIFKSNLLAFVISVPLTFIMVQHFGLIGAALSALSARFINSICQLRYSVIGLKKRVSDVFPIQTLLQLVGIGGALLVVLWNVQHLIPYRILRMLLSGGTFVVVYTAICCKAQIFNLFEEKPIRKVLLKMNLAKV